MLPQFSQAPETLEGVIERITYYNQETGYSVLKIKPNKPRYGIAARDGTVAVVGNLPELQPGESVRFTGQWVNHKEHGKQFQAAKVDQMLPATIEGLKRYLGSGMIKGVGPVTAKRIVDHFGMDTLDMLDQRPDRLRDIPGIGGKRAEWIMQGWQEQKQIKEIMLFLQSHAVSTAIAVKIFKAYGDDSINVVQRDPYRLAREIHGIGFKTADKIAQNLGLPSDSPERIAAGVIFALNELTDDGNVYGTREQIVTAAAEMLGLTSDVCEVAIERLFSNREIQIETIPAEDGQATEAIYIPAMYYSEKGVATRILGMTGLATTRLRRARTIEWSAFFERLRREDKIELTAQQQEAVQAALTHKISVLTGGPGTGKTTTLRAVIRALESIEARYALASPTGRAAKRLSEATNRAAKTLHRLLGYKPPEGFMFNENNPLDVDILVVDEASMLDLVLFYSVLRAISPETHLLLVGDVDQLPSVGAGDVLRDLIRSQAAHVTRLNTIFRQQGGSLIITNAHHINRGEMPDLTNNGSDFFLFAEREPDAAVDLLVDVVQNRIPKRFGLNPMDDIQVLAPMKRGTIGIDTLNERLQATLNPPGRAAEKQIGGRTFRVGDKVMQTRNNYDKDVYNGDIGRIHAIDFTEQTMQIVIDGRFVEYEWTELDELLHAYAVSVHRSQGSEYPCVVMPVVSQHWLMLQRNLLYTGVTRAKKLVVLIGTRWAIEKAVGNDAVAQRASGLAWRLTKR
ncbi:MAG: ATP-dependent RecD-like DNA helicase [Anaerolineae bacterium]|nr:ATP-dependent RecD-like DNA helicase [Anaerolineae bacterium]